MIWGNPVSCCFIHLPERYVNILLIQGAKKNKPQTKTHPLQKKNSEPKKNTTNQRKIVTEAKNGEICSGQHMKFVTFFTKSSCLTYVVYFQIKGRCAGRHSVRSAGCVGLYFNVNTPFKKATLVSAGMRVRCVQFMYFPSLERCFKFHQCSLIQRIKKSNEYIFKDKYITDNNDHRKNGNC